MSRTAIITGASTGIGYTTAKLFLDKGYNLVLNSSNNDNLQKAFKDLGEPSNIITVLGNVADKATGELLANAAIDNFGKIDVLINNAGVFAPNAFLDVEEEELDKYWSVNLKGTYFVTQAVVKRMIEAGAGSIINIGTVLVDHAIAGFPATAPLASKGAIHALTKQLAAEFAKNNIRVNAIAPGVIRSPLQAKIGVEDPDNLGGLHLLNRIGETIDIAEIALTLAESTFLTGEIINVDGGHVAGHQI